MRPNRKRRVSLCMAPGCTEMRLPGTGQKWCEYHANERALGNARHPERLPERTGPSGQRYDLVRKDSAEPEWLEELDRQGRQVRATLRAFGIGRL